MKNATKNAATKSNKFAATSTASKKEAETFTLNADCPKCGAKKGSSFVATKAPHCYQCGTPKAPAKKSAPAPKKKEAAKKSAPAPKKTAAKKAPAKKVPAKKAKAYNFEPSKKIVVITDANPGREGTKRAEWFSLYRKAKTVGRYLEMGGDRGYLRYDVNHGLVKVA